MSLSQIVGNSAWTRGLRQRIAQAAGFTSSVLITGPSGTGKELVARAIHEQSGRTGPLVPVDCTALSGDLFSSHLFGHVKGAFTGADHERLGCFRAADGGTIFLDELGEISLELQAKLLRTVQERVVVSVGSERPIAVDVRIVAATNRDLHEEVRAGRFRLDLFYRLNVLAFETLALRERPNEVEPLASHFLEKVTAEQGLGRKRFSAAALASLRGYAWPGNVRELQNVIERAVVFARGDVIDVDELVFDRQAPAAPAAPAMPVIAPRVESAAPWATLEEVEREHIRSTLERTLFNQSAAARLLDIDRASLARKVERFSIALPAVRRGRPRKGAVERRRAAE